MADGKENNEEKKENSQFSIKNIYHKIQSFKLKDEIGLLRDEANYILAKTDDMCTFMKEKVHSPFIWMDDMHQYLHNLSDQINKDYPYAASLCHSHSTLIVTGSVLFTGYPIRKAPRPLFLGVVLTSFLASQTSCFLFNFKYNFPYDPAKKFKAN